MSKSKRKQIRERQRRQKLRSNLIWGGVGLVALVIIVFFVFRGSGQSSPVGEQIAVSADYVNHVEEGTDPGPFPSNPPAGGSHYASASIPSTRSLLPISSKGTSTNRPSRTLHK